MNLLNLSIILLILITLTLLLLYDYKKGLYSAVFLFIFLTPGLIIEVSGSFPNFTIHRLILIIVLIFWIITKKRQVSIGLSKIPFISLLFLIGFINLISLMISVDFTYSLKTFLSLTIEVLLFYIVLATSLCDKKDALRMLNYICFALAIVALLAIIERYTGFNPVDSYIQGYKRNDKYALDVLSTYPHRILLGTAMAMGWPVAMTLIDNENRKQLRLVGAVILLITGCYFSFSRGPWIASIIAGLIMFTLGSFSIKKKLSIIVLLVLCVLILKPGVSQTFVKLGEETFNPETVKGSSYAYRWELWQKAYKEVNKSTQTILLGYGPGTSQILDLTGYVSYSDHISDFWSWDNHYACYLIETGFIGLSMVIILYTSIFISLFIIWKRIDKSLKDIMACIIASITVMLFMMTNVYIFAPQLNYLFWSLISIGFTLGYQNTNVFFRRDPEIHSIS